MKNLFRVIGQPKKIGGFLFNLAEIMMEKNVYLYCGVRNVMMKV